MANNGAGCFLLLLITFYAAIPHVESFLVPASTLVSPKGISPASSPRAREGHRQREANFQGYVRKTGGRTPILMSGASLARAGPALHEMDYASLLEMVPKHLVAANRVITYSRKVFIPLTRLCR